MTNRNKLINTTVLLAVAFNAGAQLSKAPAPPAPPRGGTPPQAMPPAGGTRHVQRFERFSPDRTRTLVIPSADSDREQNLAQVEEDLNVMSRILEKALNVAEDPIHLAMGITLEGRLFGNASSPRNMYLE